MLVVVVHPEAGRQRRAGRPVPRERVEGLLGFRGVPGFSGHVISTTHHGDLVITRLPRKPAERGFRPPARSGWPLLTPLFTGRSSTEREQHVSVAKAEQAGPGPRVGRRREVGEGHGPPRSP